LFRSRPVAPAANSPLMAMGVIFADVTRAFAP
jgi:hypothetical protein